VEADGEAVAAKSVPSTTARSALYFVDCCKVAFGKYFWDRRWAAWWKPGR
jgi:hypothetical protein